jgi:hypothetical protein
MTPLFKKLNLKDHPEILILNAPESFLPEMDLISATNKVIDTVDLQSGIRFAMVFVRTLKEIEDAIKSIEPKLSGDAILWFCYPKSSSKKYQCEFNRDTGWSFLGNYGFEGVRQVAIDEDWSALRFRKIEYIKTISRNESFALSSEGKSRAMQNKKRKEDE